MGIGETTILFYLLIGAGVAAAAWLAGGEARAGEQTFRLVSAALFWPLFLPVLLQRPRERQEAPPAIASAPAQDEMARIIEQVEAELDQALGSLDGWAEESLAHEQHQLGELRAAWRLQADRVRELDRLLQQPQFQWEGEAPAEPETSDETAPGSDRARQSKQARRENIERLQNVRCRLHDDLMGTLAWVRELVTMIHLAKFTGAPPSRAEELVAQIAASVEGLSEVSRWQEAELVGKP